MMQKISDNFLVRVMKKRDINSIKKIEDVCFSEPWSEESIIKSLNNDNTYFIVAENRNEIVGYAGMYYVYDEGYMYNIAVSPGFRNLGIGKILMQKLIDFCLDKKLSFLTLEVRKSNEKAINLYKKLQFNPVGYRKNFYVAPQEDAIIMTLNFGHFGKIN